jgi:hypothetical protein
MEVKNYNDEVAYEDVKEKQKRQKKKKYCSICGSIINNELNKCEQCGKQYFKLSIDFLLITILFVLLIGATAYIYFLNNGNKKLNIQVTYWEKQYEEKRDEYVDLLIEQNSKIDFMDRYIVIVSNDGTKKYHKYGCEDLNLSTFWIYDIEEAVSKGFIMCKKCNGTTAIKRETAPQEGKYTLEDVQRLKQNMSTQQTMP